MLGFIRKGLSSFVVTILIGLLVISFAVFGIGDVFRFNTGNAVAVVGDTKISPAEFVREFQNTLNSYRQQSGTEISVSQAKELGLPQQVLEQMVSRATFDQAGQKLKLGASDNQIYELVHGIPAFQNSFNEFDKELYDNVLRQSGLTPRQFEDMARADIPREQLLRTLGMSARMPAALVTRLYAYHGEERSIDFFHFPASAITNIPDPTDAQIQAAYDADKAKYMAPEYRALSYLVVDANQYAGDIEVTDADVQSYYDSRPELYSQPEQREISQIITMDQAQAEKAAAELQAGKDFAAVAQEVAQMTAEDTSLGLETKEGIEGSLGQAAADALFALEKDAVSAPIESNFGWHIFKVNQIIEGEVTSLESVRSSVEAEVRKEKAVDKVYEVTSAIEDDVASGATLAEIAQKLNLTLSKVQAVDAQGFSKDGSKAALPEFKGFLEQAFASEVGADLELQEASPSQYFIVSVDNVTATTLRSLADVRDEVIENWKAAEQSKAAKGTAEAAQKALIAGKPFDEVKASAAAGQQNVLVARLPKPGTANLPPEFKTAAFSIPSGQSTIMPAPDGNGFILINVTVAKPGDPQADAEIFAEVTRGLEMQYGNDVLVAYRNSLQREFETRYFEQLFKLTIDQING